MLKPAYQLIKRDYRSFFAKCMSTLGEDLDDDRYLDYLCFQCQEIVRDESGGVVIVVNLPPRHAKTLIFSICLTSWILAHNPKAKILVIAYSESLAQEITYKIRKIMRAKWYNRIFFTRLAGDRASVGNFTTTLGGQVFATSIEGELAGRGGDYIIIDDPLNISEAANEKRIAHVNHRYDTAIASRRDKPRTGKTIVVAHRLHENDLSAHILAKGKCAHIVLPMQAEREETYRFGGDTWTRNKGDLLRADHKTEDEIQNDRETYYNPDFGLFFQQGVYPSSSPRLTEEDFKPVSKAVITGLPCVISVDPGQSMKSTASFSVIQVWLTDLTHHYLVEQFQERCSAKELKRALKRRIARYDPSAVLIEKTALGHYLISEMPASKNYAMVPVTPRGGKEQRLLRHIPAIRKGRVHVVIDGEGIGDFLSSITEFPHGADDPVDAFTQVMDYVAKKPALRAPQPKVRAVVSNGTYTQVVSASGNSSEPQIRGLAAVSFPFRRRY